MPLRARVSHREEVVRLQQLLGGRLVALAHAGVRLDRRAQLVGQAAAVRVGPGARMAAAAVGADEEGGETRNEAGKDGEMPDMSRPLPPGMLEGGMPSGGRQLVGVGAVSCDGGTGAHADMVVHACSVKTTRPSHVAWSSASSRKQSSVSSRKLLAGSS